MTAPATGDRQTTALAAQLFQQRQDLDWDGALTLATDQLAVEREALAELTSKGNELAASLEAFGLAAALGCNGGPWCRRWSVS